MKNQIIILTISTAALLGAAGCGKQSEQPASSEPTNAASAPATMVPVPTTPPPPPAPAAPENIVPPAPGGGGNMESHEPNPTNAVNTNNPAPAGN